jgi:MoxR-like ATPase
MTTTAEAPPAPSPNGTSAPNDIRPLVAKLDAIRTELKHENVESEHIVDLAIACAIARGHLFIVGGAGVAKSQLIDGLFRRLPGRKFTTQARADMDSQAFFGPISLKGLENDVYEHAIAGMLADCEYAYIDELIDANDMVMRSTLRAMNERQFANGRQMIDIPLRSLYGTTNFWRTEPEIEAVMDRFMARAIKEPVKTREGFRSVIDGYLDRLANGRQWNGFTALTMDELDALQAAHRTVAVAKPERKKIETLWANCQKEGLTNASVRRFNIGLELCMARAIMRGSRKLGPEDLTAYADVLPSDPDEFPKVAELCADFAGAGAKAARELQAMYKPYAEELATLQGAVATDGLTPERSQELINLAANIKTVLSSAEQKITEGQAQQEDVNDLLALQQEIKGAQAYISKAIVGI